MSIFELKENDHENIQKVELFSENQWKIADKEHYGDEEVDFSENNFTLVYLEREKILGKIEVKVTQGIGLIEALLVSYDSQGKKIGSKLLSEAEDKLIKLNAHKVWLETGADWRAKDFYLKHDYTVRTILPKHVGRHDFVLMDKFLV